MLGKEVGEKKMSRELNIIHKDGRDDDVFWKIAYFIEKF